MEEFNHIVSYMCAKLQSFGGKLAGLGGGVVALTVAVPAFVVGKLYQLSSSTLGRKGSKGRSSDADIMRSAYANRHGNGGRPTTPE